MNATITTETYEPVKMERLRHFLESHAERGRPRYFEIFVDNLKVVDRTNDPGSFEDYAMYITEDTRMIKVLKIKRNSF